MFRRANTQEVAKVFSSTVNLPTNWPLACLLISLFPSTPLLFVSIYEHTYGADIARMTFLDEMSLDSPTFPFLRSLIGTFLQSWFIPSV